MRSVVVTKYVPWPPNGGDKWRTLGLLRALRERGEVVVCAFAGADEDAGPLADEGIEVVSIDQRRSVGDLAGGFARTRSLTAARFWDPRLHALVKETVGQDTDVLMVGHVQLLPYASGTHPGTLVLDMHNIESSLAARISTSTRGVRRLAFGYESRALRAMERRSTAADVVSVVSEIDRATLSGIVDLPSVVVVPNAWGDPAPLPPAADPVVSFVAMLSWGPNVDAALWFVRAVWPLVLGRVPAARLQLVGRNPTKEVQALAGPSVVVTGTVPELETWYASTRVCVAPLLAGGGSRLKILESLAAGRPLVATTVGAEGLEDLVGRGVVVADRPAEMADAVVALLQDPERAAAAGLEGAAAVGSDHSWSAAVRPLLDELPA